MSAGLDQVTDFPALVEYLRDELEWPIADADFEALTFDYKPEEVGLDSAKVGGGIEIKQLRPLSRKQPWGIFFINLPKKHLSTTILRTLLGNLAPKKRASSNPAERAVFDQRDLMFIANTGEAGHRHIDFAHFRAPAEGERAAPLQVLGWDADDTERRMRLTGAVLHEKLHWPEPEESVEQWRHRWTDAFREPPHYAVKQSAALAEEMAKLAKRIRNRATELIAVETEKGALRKLYAGFKEALIHDLTPAKFADYYAQTITYGLFSARVSQPSVGFGHDTIHLNVAGTSPFLKEMLAQFLKAGGRKAGSGDVHFDFDALGVSDVVALLEAADMDSVLADWDHRNQDEDPVVRFYEDFLKLYDPDEKKKRGVFYTPRPVVSFIVRAVDEVIRTEFGLEDGLASVATWAEVVRGDPSIQLPLGTLESDAFVRILDPATGTGTFLVECVDLIHRRMLAKWKSAGKTGSEIAKLWNDYVPKHLLPRLTGFELMMAPYAIAHVKLGLKLADTGYTFASDARAQIYLTNALEPAQDLDMQLSFMSEALAHEAKAANAAKDRRFTVVLGNPPYAEKSNNRHPWIEALMEDFKTTIRSEEAQIKTVSNDYVKFIRFALSEVENSPVAVMGFITSSGFLDGPLFRDARRRISSENRRVRILNLHGSGRRGDAVGGDENVFEIQQGVCISIVSTRRDGEATEIVYGELIGPQNEKLAALNASGLRDLFVQTLTSNSNARPFVPFENSAAGHIEEWPINHVFGSGNPRADRNKRYGAGFKSRQDQLAVALSERELEDRIADLANPALSEAQLRAKYNLCSTDHFEFRKARAYAQQGLLKKSIRSLRYRPFDNRPMIWSRAVMCEPQDSVTSHLLPDHLCLSISRVVKDPAFRHVLAARGPVEVISLSGSTSTNAYMFPLWWHDNSRQRWLPNIAPPFAARVATHTGLLWDDCIEGSKQDALAGIITSKPEQTQMFDRRRERGEPGKTFGPRDLFDYVYAILHSPAYRSRYADQLKSDFAVIPVPGSRALFEALVPLGTELVALHLLDVDASPILRDPKSVRLAGSGEARISMPAARFEDDAFEDGRMYIAADKARWFETIPTQAADFLVGGYMPARKWLKDRAARGGKKASPGRILTQNDILHYQRMIVALTRTAELMPKIDEVIENHGGWPDAFQAMSDVEEVA